MPPFDPLKDAYTTRAYIPYLLYRLPKGTGFTLLELEYLNGDKWHNARALQSAIVRFTDKFSLSNGYDKIAVHVRLPSPTGHRDDSHGAALVIDHKKQTVEYQDPHGLPMPRPLLLGLMREYSHYTLINHQTVQQLDGELSCAVYTLENIASMAVGMGIASNLPHTAYRAHHAPFLKAAERAVMDHGSLSRYLSIHWPETLELKCGLRSADLTGEERKIWIPAFWQHDFPHVSPARRPGERKPPREYKPPHRPEADAGYALYPLPGKTAFPHK